MKQMEHKIDTLHYDDLANRDHSSVFDENETYDMLIVRLPEIKEMQKRKKEPKKQTQKKEEENQ